MSILLFIIILFVLVLVHEFGHFIVAKKNNIRVDEFGFGYPPRAAKLFKRGETEFTLNWLPFGGFVKIFGEDPNDESMNGPDKSRALIHKPARIQAAVLIAGVVFNWVMAWILLSIGFMSGLPAAISDNVNPRYIQDQTFRITQVVSDSPAGSAGLMLGDTILSVTKENETLTQMNPEGLIAFVSSTPEGKSVTFTIDRKGTEKTIVVAPAEGVVEGKRAIGVTSDVVGVLKLPIHKALLEGVRMTWSMTTGTVTSLASLIRDAFTGKANLDTLSGPVGIVGIVGDAYKFGFVYLMSFTALISINLAIINLIPFPALDGGRLLFLVIEKIKGSRIKPAVSNTLNAIGFFVLIALMLIVTYHDIVKLL